MFRSNKITLVSANEIIDSLMETSEIISGTGAVVITQKNGKKTVNTGAIYLRDGLIYAADIAGHKVPIGKRIETGALVESDDLQETFRKVSGDITSPRIVDYLLQNHMIAEKILSSYVKEHFIEILGKIMSWDNCLGEWHPNSVTKDFVMPFVTFDRIREILARRKNVYGEFLRLTEKFMRPEELPELTFTLLKAPAPGQSPTTLKIIALCDSKNTIDDIADATGITFYNVFQTIVGLWRDGLLALNIGGIRLPYTAVLVEPEPEPVPPVIAHTNPPIPVYDEADGNSAEPEPEPDTTEETSAAEPEKESMESPTEADEDDSNSNETDVKPEEDVAIIDPVAHGEEIPNIAADWAEKNGYAFHHFTGQEHTIENEREADNDSVFYNPVREVGSASESTVDVVSSETRNVLPKDIVDRRNKVEQINNKLNQLEADLAQREKELRQNQLELEGIEERKTWLENELGDLNTDYRRTLAEADKIKESYESIRKEVEETINSFTFIEGE